MRLFSNPERVESHDRRAHCNRMAQSLAKILIHTVFSTKERRPFLQDESLRDELHSLKLPNVDLRELSMGMTHDYLVAVEEGATIVRIGTALFGPRRT